MIVQRHIRIIAGVSIAAAVILVRLFIIQIVDPKYKNSADNQSMKRMAVYPSRGIILDRNGGILVGNTLVYDILVTPRELSKVEFDTLELAQVLEIDPQYIRERFDYYNRNRSRIGWRQEVFLKRVQPRIYSRFSEVKHLFPAFSAVARSAREYPVNAGGNLLGYCSEVNESFMSRHPGEYERGDYAGKTGIESIMEEKLRGEKGYRIYLRGSDSRIKEHYLDGALDKQAVAGVDIVTSIDASLQSYAQKLMKNKVGAVVAIEPSSGEILTLVSSPCIDVEDLGQFNRKYKELVDNPYRPLMDRAVSSSYPPGSVFKLVNGLIALEEGVLTPSQCYPCHGGYQYGNRKLGCHNHFSPLNMEQSIMTSCNSYYCYVLKRILDNPKYKDVGESFSAWRDYVLSFGFGTKLGSDFPSEKAGYIPTAAFYDKIYRKRWTPTTVISLSIGQGEIGCTPLHIANLAATIANRGYYYIPHIVKASDDYDIDPKYYERHYTKVDTSHFEKIIPGMYKAVNGGSESGATAWTGAVPGLDICGKTGTAQNPRGDDNSVFICFAPKDNPRIAVAVYVENGGFGATWAVPIASLIVEKYLTGEVSRPEMEARMLSGNLMYKVKPYK